MSFARILAVVAALGANLPTASAVVAPGGVVRPDLEVASGSPVRNQRVVDYDRPPSRTRAAWQDFRQDVGGTWHASFDRHTQVPARVYGEGIAVPFSVGNAAVAETYARQMLAQRIDLLAPGARASDFVVVANDLWRGMRTVAFRQYEDGMKVIGGQVNFRFKNDRMFVIGSEAIPDLDVTRPARTVGAATARANALAWIEADFGAAAEAGMPGAPSVLPLIRANGVEAHVVLGIEVTTRTPAGKWTVYVDARTGAPVARLQMLRFVTGTISYNAPERRPGSTRVDYPASFARVNVNGTNINADVEGAVAGAGGPGEDAADVGGVYASVDNTQGAEVTGPFSLTEGGSAIWNRATVEFEDAQLSAFIHANGVKEWARPLASYMTWLDEQIPVTVNRNDMQCNAFSDGNSINFYELANVSGFTCENTARLADVVRHEFGHSFHFHAIIDGAGGFDGALSEGLSDFVASTIANDSGMGRGFFTDDAPLREIGSPDRVWPDDIHPDTHETGIIYAGAMWDLRANLVAIHGEAGAVAIIDPLFADSIRTTPDISTSYVEVLTHDDDNGNLADGTPNQCAIDDAFARHGLAATGVEGGPGVQRPRLDPQLTVVVPVVVSDCPGAAVETAEVVWKRRTGGAPATIAMTANAEGYEAQIPAQPAGTVVQYQVNVTLENGTVVTFPDNPADDFYETFVGEVTEIYCTDFESDPDAEGWTHALVSGMPQEGADDWQWGIPQGTPGSGDPSAAYSGENVYGNDLGGGNFNGMYQPDKVNELLSPVVDVAGATNVRLQYRRWLGVEDATYDHGVILANGEQAWVNLQTGGGSTNHVDKEWRFQDVDLTPFITDGAVQVAFRIESDPGLELGGWNIDDFCIVAFAAGPAECGNGVLELPEECDDGNTAGGDGCAADCTDEGGPGDPDGGVVDFPDAGGPGADSEGGCGCRAGSTGTAGPGAALLVLGAAILFARRRRR